MVLCFPVCFVVFAWEVFIFLYLIVNSIGFFEVQTEFELFPERVYTTSESHLRGPIILRPEWLCVLPVSEFSAGNRNHSVYFKQKGV